MSKRTQKHSFTSLRLFCSTSRPQEPIPKQTRYHPPSPHVANKPYPTITSPTLHNIQTCISHIRSDPQPLTQPLGSHTFYATRHISQTLSPEHPSKSPLQNKEKKQQAEESETDYIARARSRYAKKRCSRTSRCWCLLTRGAMPRRALRSRDL